eukprot:CAMPEP_0205822364 /NCGR_PEP_ID=MMETSP0206-20130828/12126_1 /ASSEMBLY_ACC=CAM_ASM_000279 /TAXON_ID=36767 /ORGANISM="Euplotes focardii, Strain TN1" /LENGTH=157 /DNA_ID=CAMNT_0053118569 /DNA_START=12 /DNA_END=486 /DNA_ORIENTATION=-
MEVERAQSPEKRVEDVTPMPLNPEEEKKEIKTSKSPERKSRSLSNDKEEKEPENLTLLIKDLNHQEDLERERVEERDLTVEIQEIVVVAEVAEEEALEIEEEEETKTEEEEDQETEGEEEATPTVQDHHPPTEQVEIQVTQSHNQKFNFPPQSQISD